MRIGYGEDIHRIEESGRPLVLCGVNIDSNIKISAHSDGDVAAHALMDALLGAIGEKDIGYHFPVSDDRWEKASSLNMLSMVVGMIENKNYAISNVDVTIIAEKPHLSPYREKMIDKIAKTLNIDNSAVSIKFGTNEKIDDIGNGKAIKSVAVVLLEEKR